MIRRKQYSEEFKRKLVLELEAGIATVAEISKREGICTTVLYKWQKQAGAIEVSPDEGEVLVLRRQIRDLEETVSEQALQIHILKKTQKIMAELKKQERLSGAISPRTSESKKALKP
jgi:transposase-like protein